MNSVLVKQKRCLLCGKRGEYYPLHLHHVFEGTGRRKISEKYGATVWLCPEHHNLSDNSIHFNRYIDLRLKASAQRKLMQLYGWSKEDFIKIFGKSYI